MSGSRKSLKKGTIFNPRASNEWSKDDSKFGQRMLEKMGWKLGQGIGLNNQGITENIKVRLKLDNKGLGYQIKEDQWLEVRSEFSDLLSQLSQGVEDENEAFNKDKKSLEAVSQSSKTRVHYHKFTHGKDIARYKKEDLIGILGKKESKEESLVPENKEFIQSGNMEEYFKSRKELKSNDSDFSCTKNEVEIDNQNNDSNVKPNQEEEPSDSKTNSNSRKRKKSAKLDKECEIEELCENELIDEKSTNQCTDGAESKKPDDSSPTRRKRKRNLDIPSENNDSDVCHQSNNFIMESVQENDLKLNSPRRKKSVKKLPNECEIKEWNKNTAELINELTEDRNIASTTENGIIPTHRGKKHGKKSTFNFASEPENGVALEEKMQTNPQVAFDQNNINEKEPNEVEDDCSQLESSRKGKKKKLRKSNEILTPVISEESNNADMTEKSIENDKNETRRRRKHKSNHAEEQPNLNDDISLTATSLSPVIDDSAPKLKKVKSKVEKVTDSCLMNDSDPSVQETRNEKSKIFNTIDNTSADFMKTVIDYNSCNNVEDFIANFEKNREELLNKYREKYKMKYLMSASDKIVIYGDEFDGRKLDCKKTKPENMPVMKILDRKNMSKAEKIVAKARLLQMIKDETATHNFEGSNLTSIAGYGM